MAEDKKTECPNNVRLFQIAVCNNLKNIAESVSENVVADKYFLENEFFEIFTILKSRPKIIRKLHKTMIEELFSSMSKDLEDLLTTDDLQNSMIKVTRLSEEAAKFDIKKAWRPPGDVSLHLRSLDAHMMKKASEELEKQIAEMEEANETLMKTIAESRSRVYATNNNLTNVLNHAPNILQQLEKTYEQLVTCIKSIENE